MNQIPYDTRSLVGNLKSSRKDDGDSALDVRDVGNMPRLGYAHDPRVSSAPIIGVRKSKASLDFWWRTLNIEAAE